MKSLVSDIYTICCLIFFENMWQFCTCCY
eukprot:UN19375